MTRCQTHLFHSRSQTKPSDDCFAATLLAGMWNLWEKNHPPFPSLLVDLIYIPQKKKNTKLSHRWKFFQNETKKEGLLSNCLMIVDILLIRIQINMIQQYRVGRIPYTNYSGPQLGVIEHHQQQQQQSNNNNKNKTT